MVDYNILQTVSHDFSGRFKPNIRRTSASFLGEGSDSSTAKEAKFITVTDGVSWGKKFA